MCRILLLSLLIPSLYGSDFSQVANNDLNQKVEHTQRVKINRIAISETTKLVKKQLIDLKGLAWEERKLRANIKIR